MPKGCDFTFHSPGRVVVRFYANDRAKSGLFIVQHACQSRNADLLIADLCEIVSLLPRTEATQGFRW